MFQHIPEHMQQQYTDTLLLITLGIQMYHFIAVGKPIFTGKVFFMKSKLYTTLVIRQVLKSTFQ